jgi:hypothetical protein
LPSRDEEDWFDDYAEDADEIQIAEYDITAAPSGLAMLVDGHNHAPSMVRFLNQFSRKSRGNTEKKNKYIYELLESFFDACEKLPTDAFLNKRSRRFNVALYEASFAAACAEAFQSSQNLKTTTDLLVLLLKGQRRQRT